MLPKGQDFLSNALNGYICLNKLIRSSDSIKLGVTLVNAYSQFRKCGDSTIKKSRETDNRYALINVKRNKRKFNIHSMKAAVIALLAFGLLQSIGCAPGGNCGNATPISVTGFNQFSHFGKITVQQFGNREIVDFVESDLSEIAESDTVLYLGFERDNEFGDQIGWTIPSLISNAYALSCADPEVLNPVASMSISLRSPDGGESILSPTGFYHNYSYDSVTPMSELHSTEFLPNGSVLVLDMDESEIMGLSVDDVFVVTVITHDGKQFFTEIPIVYRFL